MNIEKINKFLGKGVAIIPDRISKNGEATTPEEVGPMQQPLL